MDDKELKQVGQFELMLSKIDTALKEKNLQEAREFYGKLSTIYLKISKTDLEQSKKEELYKKSIGRFNAISIASHKDEKKDIQKKDIKTKRDIVIKIGFTKAIKDKAKRLRQSIQHDYFPRLSHAIDINRKKVLSIFSSDIHKEDSPLTITEKIREEVIEGKKDDNKENIIQDIKEDLTDFGTDRTDSFFPSVDIDKRDEENNTSFLGRINGSFNDMFELALKKEKPLRYGAIALIAIILISFLMTNPAFIGLVIKDDTELIPLNLNLDENYNTSLLLDGYPESIKISGSVTENASFEVFIKDLDSNQTYLLVDETTLTNASQGNITTGQGLAGLTGLVIYNESVDENSTIQDSTIDLDTYDSASDTIEEAENITDIIGTDETTEENNTNDTVADETTITEDTTTDETTITEDTTTDETTITEDTTTDEATITEDTTTDETTITEDTTTDEATIEETISNETMTFFNNICDKTCILTDVSENLSLEIKINDATLNLSQLYVTYSERIIRNNPPQLTRNFTDFKFLYNTNYTIDAYEYWVDKEDDLIRLSTDNISNITVIINRSLITLVPDENFTGSFNLTIFASDPYQTSTSNIISVKVVQNMTETTQIVAVIGTPVKWQKTVQVMNVSPVIAIDLHKDAFNISIKKKNETAEENISKENITVVDEGLIKDMDEYELEQKIDVINEEILVLETKKDMIIEQERYEDLEEYKNMSKKIEQLQEELVIEKQNHDLVTGQVIRDIDGKGLLTRFFNWLLGNNLTPTGAVIGITNGTDQIAQTALDEFTLTTDKDNYYIGETVTINITPPYAEISMYVFTENEDYRLFDNTFTPVETGLHTVSALVSTETRMERMSKEFLVFESGSKTEQLIQELTQENKTINVTAISQDTSIEKNITTKVSQGLITSFITEQITQEEKNETTRIILTEKDIDKTDEVIVEYNTDAPQAFEFKINETNTKIVVTSNVHYENILTYADIPNLKPSQVKLYHFENGMNRPYQAYNYSDMDGDNLIDRIYWITPHLSNQTFEIEIVVLNVQSYPVVGGNWTAYFDTYGVANLSIMTIRNTTYLEYYNDNPSTEDDLEALELRCGNETIFNKYNNYYREDVMFITNSSEYISPAEYYDMPGNSGNNNKNQGKGKDNNPNIKNTFNQTSISIKGIYIPSYNCSELGYWTVKVYTKGVHNQIFLFGNYDAYANNYANNPPITDIIIFSDGSLGKTKTFLS